MWPVYPLSAGAPAASRWWGRRRPPPLPPGQADRYDWSGGGLADVLRVLVGQGLDRLAYLLWASWAAESLPALVAAVGQDLCRAIDPDPPQGRPVLGVLVHEQAREARRVDVSQSLQRHGGFGFAVDGGVQHVVDQCEHHGDQVWPAVRGERGQSPDPGCREPEPRPVLVHLTIVLNGAQLCDDSQPGTVSYAP